MKPESIVLLSNLLSLHTQTDICKSKAIVLCTSLSEYIDQFWCKASLEFILIKHVVQLHFTRIETNIDPLSHDTIHEILVDL